jgi:ParB-like chromosome segregation protein Spo0J
MQAGDKFPPISVVERMRNFDDHTSPKYSIRDGSHRYAAAQAEGLKTIRAKVL